LPVSAAPRVTAPHRSGQGRRFLLVTLPYGRFGRLLNQALRERGAEVRHMVFNAGDLIDGRGPGAAVFRGDLRAWRDRFPEVAAWATDLVVYGETRPQGRPALEAAGSRPVWVLENGYFRPDWVTVEAGGANAHSRLPRDPEAYRGWTGTAPEPEPVGPITRHLVAAVARYYLAEALGRPAFPHHRPPFEPAPWRQALGHARRWLRMRRLEEPTAAELRSRGPFFLVCLQREGDSQLLRHSDLKTNADFLARVLDDFARHAAPELRLVVKNHPLDPGAADLRALAQRLAATRGVEARVDFLEGGVLADLSRASRGLVVNNSTAALAALGFGAPVKVLGRAFFDLPGLTHQGPLSDFWADPRAPDADLFRRFRARVIAETQINGSFEGPRLIRRTAERVADRMIGGAPPV